MEAMSASRREALLGLPLETALERARAMGAEVRIVETRAPRRHPPRDAEPPQDGSGTRRVIRVRMDDAGLELTVSDFMDGEPRKV